MATFLAFLTMPASSHPQSPTTLVSMGAKISNPTSGGPVLFFSDLTSGPNSSNSTGSSMKDGAIVTVWGAHLGSEENGQVSCGGVPARKVYFWGPARLDHYDKIVFQVSHLGRSGPGEITVTANGRSSNSLPFTVRAGKIYFVATSGRDFNGGSFASPWRTLIKARNSMQAGDITYVMDGVSQTSDDGEGWNAAFTLRPQWCGKSEFPRAMVAYPGATVRIGDNGGRPFSGIRTTDFSGGGGCEGNWVFAGLTFRGTSAVSLNGPSSNWRFVGNDISCPNAVGAQGGACFQTMLASNVKFYGNVVHDAGAANASALFHGVYFSTDSNHIDMGWNTVAHIHGCRGVQVHSSPLGSNYPNSGYDMFDLSIHDNLIHDTQCDGIILDTIDPSKGQISIHNNVIYTAGTGPNNPEHTGGWSCINVRGTTEKGKPGTGTVEIYNNTLYACGTFDAPPYTGANAGIFAGGDTGLSILLRDNLIYQVGTSLYPAGVPYVVIWDPIRHSLCAIRDNCARVRGSHNLFFGSGLMQTNPANIKDSINRDPAFRDLSHYDFHLSDASPAAHAGITTPEAADHDGLAVEPNSGYPIGAYAQGIHE